MKEAVRQQAFALGFDACGFTTAAPPASAPHLQRWIEAGHHASLDWIARNAPKRANPQAVLPCAQSVISLAVNCHQPSPLATPTPPSTPNPPGLVARYARSEDYHQLLAPPLRNLTTFLTALAGPEHRSLWYTDTGPILERDLAQRAGLGFIGKHTNLVSRSFGNWILLAEILTTIPFPPDPPESNRCGRCTRCLKACPTHAFPAPFQLDARRCISYLTIELKGPIPADLRPLIGHRVFGCDDCLEACPWNRFARTGRLMLAAARPELSQLDLIDLLSLDETAFRARFRGTPLIRTKRRGLLRNACVALGNTANSAALPALRLAATDPEPLIAEHAAWAIREIQSRAKPDC